MVNLAILACVSRTMTKKRSSGQKCTPSLPPPRENPGYACEAVISSTEQYGLQECRETESVSVKGHAPSAVRIRVWDGESKLFMYSM